MADDTLAVKSDENLMVANLLENLTCVLAAADWKLGFGDDSCIEPTHLHNLHG